MSKILLLAFAACSQIVVVTTSNQCDFLQNKVISLSNITENQADIHVKEAVISVQGNLHIPASSEVCISNFGYVNLSPLPSCQLPHLLMGEDCNFVVPYNGWIEGGCFRMDDNSVFMIGVDSLLSVQRLYLELSSSMALRAGVKLIATQISVGRKAYLSLSQSSGTVWNADYIKLGANSNLKLGDSIDWGHQLGLANNITLGDNTEVAVYDQSFIDQNGPIIIGNNCMVNLATSTFFGSLFLEDESKLIINQELFLGLNLSISQSTVQGNKIAICSFMQNACDVKIAKNALIDVDALVVNGLLKIGENAALLGRQRDSQGLGSKIEIGNGKKTSGGVGPKIELKNNSILDIRAGSLRVDGTFVVMGNVAVGKIGNPNSPSNLKVGVNSTLYIAITNGKWFQIGGYSMVEVAKNTACVVTHGLSIFDFNHKIWDKDYNTNGVYCTAAGSACENDLLRMGEYLVRKQGK